MKHFIIGVLVMVVMGVHAMDGEGGGAQASSGKLTLKEEVRREADATMLDLSKKVAQMVVRVEGEEKDHAHAQDDLRKDPVFGPFIRLAYPSAMEQERGRGLSDAEAAILRKICLLASCAVPEGKIEK